MNTINDIFDFAISNEQEAFEFYSRLAERAPDNNMRRIFQQFAEEEKSHKEKLIKIKQNGFFTDDISVPNEYFADNEMIAIENFNPALNLSYRQTLLLAIHKEQAAFKLYKIMAKFAIDNFIKQILLSLAEEEEKHRNRFQQEYDNFIVNNN